MQRSLQNVCINSAALSQLQLSSKDLVNLDFKAPVLNGTYVVGLRLLERLDAYAFGCV